MTGTPSIPKSRRSLSDLDALIDHSIGQKAAYDEMHSLSQTGIDKTDKPLSIDTPMSDAPVPIPLTGSDSTTPTGSEDSAEGFERFQVKISSTVLLATKLEALKTRSRPGIIVELALRQYLNLPPRT